MEFSLLLCIALGKCARIFAQSGAPRLRGRGASHFSLYSFP